MGRRVSTVVPERGVRASGVVDRPSQSPDSPGHGQSTLAISIWTGSGADAKRLRKARRGRQPSRAPGLARARVHGRRLADQADAPADLVVNGLSHVIARLGGWPREGSGQSIALAVPDATTHSGGSSRLDPGCEWVAQSRGGWSERLPADPARSDGRPICARSRLADFTTGRGVRRSVYVHVKRSLLVPILATHDAADTDSSCPVRYTTTVPTQALGLLNGVFSTSRPLGSRAGFAGRLPTIYEPKSIARFSSPPPSIPPRTKSVTTWHFSTT